MNGPKTINGQEVATEYDLSCIGGIGERVRANPLAGMDRMPVFICAGLRALRVWRRFLPFAWVIPVAAVIGAVVGTYLLGSTIKYTPNLFFCAVVLSWRLGGVGAGTFSILLSVIALDYYFLPPIYALGLTPEETPDIIVFVTVGLFVNWVNWEGSEAKKSIREARDGRSSVFSDKNHERGRTDSVLPVDNSSGELADGKLGNEASASKDIQKFSAAPNLISDKVGVHGQRRPERCTQESGACKKQVVTLNGSRKPLRNPLTRRSERDCVFCKHGDYWTIQYKGQTKLLKATRGLECLACLLGRPDREFHVSELVGPVTSPVELRQYRVQKDGHQMRTLRLESGDPILDSQAKAEYKLRLADLRAELEEAERCNDADRAEKIQQESDTIAEQLAVAAGLSGRDRKTTSQAERARSAVTKRIRGSIKRIAKATPSLGRHLSASIKTGYFCSYNPDPDCSVGCKIKC